MKNNKRPSIRMRLLAWMMAAIMMCTGLNVTAYAQEISFDEGYALEQQEEQVTDEENAEEIQQDEADPEISFEGPWDTEDTDEDDITIEDAQVQDDTDTEETDADEVEVFSDADDQNAVEAFSDGDSESDGETAKVTVNFSFSQDDRFADDEFEDGAISKPVALKQLTVPYFDLANYGLEKFYFKSEKYSSSDKGTTGMVGTAETARNHVTLLHLIIYATEVLYCGLGDDEAGQGYLKDEEYLDDGETLNITGSPGSLYMEHLWGLDQNLIYYLNYEYPLASTGWGSTADQILLHDGDVVTLAHYSDWNFYSDSGAGFNYLTDENGSRTRVVADRGEKDSITFQTWRAQAGMNGGETAQNKMTGKYQLYYIPVDDMWDGDVASWTRLGETENGELKVDLDNIPNGEYFVGIPGQPGVEHTNVICSSPGGIYLNVTGSAFEGQGTETSPYELSTAKDLTRLKKLVKAAKIPENTYFVLTDDITLPEGWTPIGETIDGTNNIKSGANLRAFSGILDGQNHTITVPEGGLPLLGYVKGAEVRNLNIYGTKIAGYGLINNLEGVGLSGKAVLLDNITLKSGSSTLKSGLLGANITTNPYGGCSAKFLATVQNCTIEDGVVIGYNKDQSIIGSIAGRFNGTISNCTSNATVYGINYVGGIMGMRDNSMGDNYVTGCTFGGTVEASGQNAGGIVAGGYMDNTMSAPNAYRLNVNNCTSTGTITGADNVGGIFGGDIMVAQAWNAYTFKNNTFTGKVNATNGTNVGGIIGYYRSLNTYDDIAENTFNDDCGTTKGIGGVAFVDTSCETHETESGATYFNTANGTTGLPKVQWCTWKKNHNRTDDPLGADADKLTKRNHVQHMWDEGVVKTEATCTATGEKLYTCTYCNETRTEEIPMKEHTYDEGKVTTEPTCKEAGVKTYTCTVCQETKTEEIPKTNDHKYDSGKVTKKATCKNTGEKTYTCTVCGATKTETIAKTNDHKYTWKTTAKATVFAPAKQQGKCSVCGKTVTRNYGKKLTATIRLNATSIRLQQRRSTNKIKVTMANGDSVKSWTSSNRRIATVNNKGVITAGRQNGTARITVTLKSGKKASLNVKVQSTKVITTSISGLKASETLKRGQKLTLKPVVNPITSQEGITYASSNRNVAVVNSKGVITARAKGSARITVRSGRKYYTIRVTVK